VTCRPLLVFVQPSRERDIALEHRVEQQLGAVDLAHRPDQLAVVLVLVEVVRGLPAEVSAGLDPRGDVAEDAADVLVVDDRIRAAPRCR
jgi:hypothetical protein